MFSNIKKNGFTLLEAVITTAIVMVGIIGILIVSQDSLLIVYFSRDRLTAAYLAKEGTEIVRNIRDKNWLRGELWNAGLDAGTLEHPKIYEAQYNSENLMDWGGTLEPLKVDTITRIFSYDINDELTVFKREIAISSLSPGVDGIKIRVNVSWRDYSLSLEENLYNWRQ